MNLKLAEYKDGKFERFVELGSNYGNFFYCRDCVGIWDESPEIKNGAHYFQDEKDPLNRFNGLFDGQTYGNGRFVLIEIVNNYPDYEFFKSGEDFYISHYGIAHKRFDKGGLLWRADYDELDNPDMVKVGNIFQNPELWEKVK